MYKRVTVYKQEIKNMKELYTGEKDIEDNCGKQIAG